MRKIGLTLLILSLLSGCSLFYSSQQAPSPADNLDLDPELHDLDVVTEPDLVEFFMNDTMIGWGLTGEDVLRTMDGGRTWMAVTPDENFSYALDQQAYFLDFTTAWILVSGGSQTNAGHLYHTRDGGLTWQVFEPPFSTAQLDFVDGRHGWALTITGAAAGSSGAEIYNTTDGGAQWNLVHRTDGQSLDRGGQLPFSGTKNGLAFRNESHGFLGGSVPAEGAIYLYETNDAGISWQQSTLPLPEYLQRSFLSFEAPEFFSPEQGKLVVHFQGPDGAGVTVFTTNNGGQRWLATNPVPMAGQVDFANMQAGRVWDGELLYATNDGGQIWVRLAPDLTLQEGSFQYQFINVDVGFTLVLDQTHRLYRSGDGGADWTRLP
jgi:photosystem II stability/assembly factor-like uncharacterized protein